MTKPGSSEGRGAKKSGKRPYRPPVIRTERVYERKSLACAKVSLETPACQAVGLGS